MKFKLPAAETVRAAMRVLCPRALAILLLLSTLSISLQAQVSHMTSGEARVTGHVRDAASRQPLTSVKVEVSSIGGVAAIYVQTGTDGEFHIGGLVDGNFDLIIDEKGYLPYREHFTLANGNLVVMNVDLEKAPGEAESAPGTLSTHELTVPQKARDAFAKGMTLKAKPDYAGALEQFQKAIKLYPDYYEAYAEAGAAEVNLNKPADADRDLQKSVEMSQEKYPVALFYQAGELNNTNKFAEAEAAARKGLELDANSWRGQFEMARALLGLKRPGDAVPYAAKARDLNPGNSQVYIVVMNADIQTRNYLSAVGAIDSYLKLTATGPQADQVRRVREQLQGAIQKAAQQKAAEQTSPAPPQKPQ